MVPGPQSNRLRRTADAGRIVAQGRKRLQLSQQEFAQRIGVSRKTLSDLERGALEHISFDTVIRALALVGMVVEASASRPPTLSEVMAKRAEYQARVHELEAEQVTHRDRTDLKAVIPSARKRR